MRFSWLTLIVTGIYILIMPRLCDAVVIGFEGLPQDVALRLVDGSVYTESGFALAPYTDNSFICPGVGFEQMIGDSTEYYQTYYDFVTFIAVDPTALFDLNSFLVGPLDITTIPDEGINIIGILPSGGSYVSRFNSLTTATTVTLNWTNINAVVFETKDYVGIDNIDVSLVPEPSTLTLLALGVVGLAVMRRRR